MSMVHSDDLAWSRNVIVEHSLISDLFHERYGVRPARIHADPNAAGDFNKCYYISFDAAPLGDESLKELVLRIARSTFPRIKTEHEVACMHALGRLAPEVVFYDSSASNELGYEYICMKRVCAPGLRLNLERLSEPAIDCFFSEFVDLVAKLWTLEMPQKICGLQLAYDGSHEAGPLLEEPMITEADIKRYWLEHSPDETIYSLNPIQTFDKWLDFQLAYLRLYLRMIETHPRLDFLHSLIPQLRKLVRRLESVEEDWIKRFQQPMPLRFFHRDIHDNQMLVSDNGSIAALLDFEFSGVIYAFEKSCCPISQFIDALRFKGTPNALALADRLETTFWPTFRSRYPALAKQVDAEINLQQVMGVEGEALDALKHYLRSCCEVGVRDFGNADAARGAWKQTAQEKLDFFESI